MRIGIVAVKAVTGVSQEARLAIHTFHDRKTIPDLLRLLGPHVEVAHGQPALHAEPVAEGELVLRGVDTVTGWFRSFNQQPHIKLDEAGTDRVRHLVSAALAS